VGLHSVAEDISLKDGKEWGNMSAVSPDKIEVEKMGKKEKGKEEKAPTPAARGLLLQYLGTPKLFDESSCLPGTSTERKVRREEGGKRETETPQGAELPLKIRFPGGSRRISISLDLL